MDEALKRRLVGAAVLLLVAFVVAALLPGAPDKAAPVVAYDLRTGKPLNLPPPEPMPPPVKLKPAEVTEAKPLEAPLAKQPEAAAPTPAQKPAVAEAKTAPAQPAAAPATPPARPPGHPVLKVDESFGAAGAAGWYVQIGSFSSRPNAQAVLQKLFKQGLPAIMQNVTVGKALWYRVRVGPYSSEAPAQQALSAVRSQGFPAAKVVRPDAKGN